MDTWFQSLVPCWSTACLPLGKDTRPEESIVWTDTFLTRVSPTTVVPVDGKIDIFQNVENPFHLNMADFPRRCYFVFTSSSRIYFYLYHYRIFETRNFDYKCVGYKGLMHSILIFYQRFFYQNSDTSSHWKGSKLEWKECISERKE